MFTFSWYGASCSAAWRLPALTSYLRAGGIRPHQKPQPCPGCCSRDPQTQHPLGAGATPAQLQLHGKGHGMATSRVGSLGATPALTRPPDSLPVQDSACCGADPAQPQQHHPFAPLPLGVEQETSPEQGTASSQVMRLTPTCCLSRQGCRQDTAGSATCHAGSWGSADSMHTWRAVGWGLHSGHSEC